MDHLSRISIFAAVVQNESFAGAGRQLGITTSAVSKQIQNLEAALKIKLLNRTTRKVSLTEEGALYYARSSRALADLQEAEEEIQELKSCPRGALKITMPHSFGIQHLSAAIAEFGHLYPDVELNINFDDQTVDLVGGGYDLAIRIGELKDSTLIAKRLASCPIILCASPAYLAAHGTPQAPADLAGHNMLAYSNKNGPHEWRYKTPLGKVEAIQLQGSFKCNSGDMLMQAACNDMGIATLPIFYVSAHIHTGALVPLLTEYLSWPRPDIYAVYMPSQYISTRLRLFIDHIAAHCNNLPWEA